MEKQMYEFSINFEYIADVVENIAHEVDELNAVESRKLSSQLFMVADYAKLLAEKSDKLSNSIACVKE